MRSSFYIHSLINRQDRGYEFPLWGCRRGQAHEERHWPGRDFLCPAFLFCVKCCGNVGEEVIEMALCQMLGEAGFATRKMQVRGGGALSNVGAARSAAKNAARKFRTRAVYRAHHFIARSTSSGVSGLPIMGAALSNERREAISASVNSKSNIRMFSVMRAGWMDLGMTVTPS